MPHKLKLSALIFLFVAKAAIAGSVSVLFVGNSLTYTNDLPFVFKNFAAQSSLHADAEVRSVTTGGATFYDHWKRGAALAVLREQRPNFLILQAQSVEPLASPQNFSYYARLFKTEADQINTKTILFATWARPAGDDYYKDLSSGGSPPVMQARLNSAYATLAQNIGATLAPVGVGFESAGRNVPAIALLDGTQHPTQAGTYLAAAILFRSIFNTSAIGSTYCGGLPETTAHTLQRIADSIPLSSQ